MSELVYPPVVVLAKTWLRLFDVRLRLEGEDHIPREGGAVIACNHVSYLDFIFCGMGAQRSGRLVRFMAKKQVFDHRISGPLMRGMHHIPVDRDAGLASFREALAALKGGEVVGVFPEATISRSFTVKEIKSGATRLAASAGVPLIPMALWGTQRLWTKGHPRRLTQRHVPVTIAVGEPMHLKRGEDPSAELHTRMSTLLDRIQREYPSHEDGAWWLPAHLGGTAPTPEAAAELDAAR